MNATSYIDIYSDNELSQVLKGVNNHPEIVIRLIMFQETYHTHRNDEFIGFLRIHKNLSKLLKLCKLAVFK